MNTPEKPLFLSVEQIETLKLTAERWIDDNPPDTDNAVDLIMYGLAAGETGMARAILSWAGIGYTVRKEETTG